jgi:NAD-dependent SIR2 family protein deacetylase
METPVDELLELLAGRRVCVLTGAGVSTESGIPDYRGPTAPPRSRPPLQHRDFVEDARTRARYWARAVLGWPRFRDTAPNAAHLALATWETSGALTGLITQNVDRLHHKAGHRDVLELHGALAEVRCLGCDTRVDRDALQKRLLRDNPTALEWHHTLLADGDAELPDHAVERFVVPDCEACGGVLKPDVVFFGDSVPRPRVESAFARLDAAEVLLVLGSSLTVFSGYRFVLRAKEHGQPVAVLNLGPTRADADATVRLEGRVGEVLPALVERLTAYRPSTSARTAGNSGSPGGASSR